MKYIRILFAAAILSLTFAAPALATQPTSTASTEPSEAPSEQPSTEPSEEPSTEPSDEPSSPPSEEPSTPPSEVPSTPPSPSIVITPPPSDAAGIAPAVDSRGDVAAIALLILFVAAAFGLVAWDQRRHIGR